MWLYKKPYQHLLISMIIMATIPLVFSLIFWWGASGVLNNQINEIIRTSHIQNQIRIENTLYELNRLSMSISNDQSIKSILQSSPSGLTSKERFDIFQARIDLKRYLANGPECIRDIYIYSNQHKLAVAGTAMRSEKEIMDIYYQDYILTAEELESLHSEYCVGELKAVGEENRGLVFTSSIPGRIKGGIPDLQLVIILNSRLLDSSFITSSNELKSYFYIFNADSKFIFTGDDDLTAYSDYHSKLAELDNNIGQITIEGNDFLAYKTDSSIGSYTFYSIISNDYIKEQTQKFTTLSITIFILCLSLAAVAVVHLTKRNYIPIEHLIKYIREYYGSGKTDIKGEGIYAIQNAVQDLIIQNHNSEKQIEDYNRKMGVAHLRDLFQGRSEQLHIGRAHFNWIDDSNYIVACFYSGFPKNRGLQGMQIDSEYYWRTVESAFSNVLSETCFWECTIINGMLATIIGSKNRKASGDFYNDEQIKSAGMIDWLEDRIEQILEYLDKRYALSVQVSISNLHTGINELETAYHEALLAMEYCFLSEEISISRFDAREHNSGSFLLDSIHLNKLLQFTGMVSSGNYEKALSLLENLFPDSNSDRFFNESELSGLQLASLKYHFLQVTDMMYRQCETVQFSRNEALRRIISCQDHYELRIVMTEQLVFGKEHLSADKAAVKDIVEEVKQFVEDNYKNNQLSVASIAEHFSILPNTLSKQFSRKTEKSLLEYIHMIRINKAMDLIENEPDIPLYEIAQKVGYSNTLTFTRAFKTYNQGKTPSEYKSIVLNNL